VSKNKKYLNKNDLLLVLGVIFLLAITLTFVWNAYVSCERKYLCTDDNFYTVEQAVRDGEVDGEVANDFRTWCEK